MFFHEQIVQSWLKDLLNKNEEDKGQEPLSTEIEDSRKHTVSVDQFIDQSCRIGISNFARYAGENYIFAGTDAEPSKDSLVSFLYRKEYKRLGEVLMSRYVEHGNRTMSLPLTDTSGSNSSLPRLYSYSDTESTNKEFTEHYHEILFHTY
mmetsp:Transcript_2324/g.5221  ORF Transcript_2324/g.5221 Transcript_2324/m.5221 type:complete len:150 (+) Transcript_2324:572-1021(+)